MAERRRQLAWWERPLENFARSRIGGWYFVNVAMRVDRVLLPLSAGRVTAAPGQQICLLETVGAKSGQVRKTPLVYLLDGDRLVLIGSKAGSPRHPAWVHNLPATRVPRCWRPSGPGITWPTRPKGRSGSASPRVPAKRPRANRASARSGACFGATQLATG